MADEPRRSGRATKGQHKHASDSPAPTPKPAKTAKSKPTKKSQEPEPEDAGEEEEIRCICGNNNPKDKRAFIGCDVCTVWQHNVCMGITDDEDDVPDHYSCEQCRPEEHVETLKAMEIGEKIWETRNKIYQSEKKMSKNRKGKGAVVPPGWLKKDVLPEQPVEQAQPETPEVQEQGSKRKRDEIKEEPIQEADPKERATRGSRQDKRRKSSTAASNLAAAAPPDVGTELVDIDKLPSDRQKIATALSKIISDVITEKAKAGFRIPDGETARSMGERYAGLIEYELQVIHSGPSNPPYMGQFRALNANLKKNKVLVERLLNGTLNANELATMESKDMASAELQKERAEMKEQLDRQAVAIQEERPRYRRTHKGDELIEDENQHLQSDNTAQEQPIRERANATGGENGDEAQDIDEEPVQATSPVQADRPSAKDEIRRTPVTGEQRRRSSQNFDMSNIWARTAGSPTSATAPRPMQVPPRRQSSVSKIQGQDEGTKDDADVDRMLQDDEVYGSAAQAAEDVVWRGKLVQSSDGTEPTVNARFVAGRDLRATVPWQELLPNNLTIDGRLQISKAEEYLCSLQWSNSSDVSILAFTPYDDAEAFNAVFQYFKSRERYAVINKDKPPMVKDMYIIPVEAGGELPQHVSMLEHCTIKKPIEERLLLATVVVARAPGTPPVAALQPEESAMQTPDPSAAANATNGHRLPQHFRASTVAAAGPAGSPMTTQPGTFSPLANAPAPVGPGGYAQQQTYAPTAGTPDSYAMAATPQGGFPLVPANQQHPPPQAASPSNTLVAEILGSLQYAPTAQQILAADPGIDREKLENLRKIMESDPATRTNIAALGRRLMG